MTQPLKQAPPAQQDNERQRDKKRWAALVDERSSWLSHWQDLNDFIVPRRFRYLQTDRNKGTKRHDKIINGKATKAARTLGAGKMAGETSPARPWFRYVISDPEAKNDSECTTWAADAERVVTETLARSNLYAKIHELWFLQGVFATAAMYVEEDEEDDVRGYVFPLGQYCLTSSARGRIDGIWREFDMTVDQMVREYGIENVSERVKEWYTTGKLDQWVTILHKIEPNVNRQTGKIDNHNMPWISVWWEKDAPEDHVKALRRSGYEEFPVMVARWDVIGEDIYGSGSPGMDALGDCKGIQLLERRKAEAVDKIVRPPLKIPVALKAQKVSLLPGDTTAVDETAQGTKVEPIIEIKAEAINAAREAIVEHENRIVEAFFANLFLMMLMDDRQQPVTAREVNERHEEKMLMLGPVVERDQDDVLDPLHNRLIRILYRRGKLLPLPQRLQGKRIKVEYISIMAQAQKLLGTSATERFVSFVGSTSAVSKKVLDIPNWDKIVKRYAEMLGLPPDEINTEEVIAQIRQAAEQQAQAQQALATAQGAADAAKVASETDMGGDTALSRLVNTVGGGGGPLAQA